MRNPWTTEQDDELRACMKEKLTFSAAAEVLNKKFGTVYTRNAVIGRSKRIGVAAGNPSKKFATVDPETRRERRAAYERRKRAERKGVTFIEALLKPAPPPVLQEPLHVSLVDLEPDHCRWPFGDGPFTFCGHPICSGSYCGAHALMAVGIGTVGEQRAHAVSRRQAA